MSTNRDEWAGVIPPTPPYKDKPDTSEAVRRAISERVGQCHRKDIHYTLAHAQMQARILRREGFDDIVAYKCGHCPHYHTGSKSKKEQCDEEYRR